MSRVLQLWGCAVLRVSIWFILVSPGLTRSCKNGPQQSTANLFGLNASQLAKSVLSTVPEKSHWVLFELKLGTLQLDGHCIQLFHVYTDPTGDDPMWQMNQMSLNHHLLQCCPIRWSTPLLLTGFKGTLCSSPLFVMIWGTLGSESLRRLHNFWLACKNVDWHGWSCALVFLRTWNSQKPQQNNA